MTAFVMAILGKLFWTFASATGLLGALHLTSGGHHAGMTLPGFLGSLIPLASSAFAKFQKGGAVAKLQKLPLGDLVKKLFGKENPRVDDDGDEDEDEDEDEPQPRGVSRPRWRPRPQPGLPEQWPLPSLTLPTPPPTGMYQFGYRKNWYWPDPYNDPECEVVGLLEVRPDYYNRPVWAPLSRPMRVWRQR